MINLILQWVAVILLMIIALGLTFGWFGKKKQTGCIPFIACYKVLFFTKAFFVGLNQN